MLKYCSIIFGKYKLAFDCHHIQWFLEKNNFYTTNIFKLHFFDTSVYME